MGFVKQVVSKVTGADLAADAAERAATDQAEATRQASETAAKATREAAAQAARSQEDSAMRNAALTKAAEESGKPLENADVVLSDKEKISAMGSARKKRQQFGIGTGNTGVNI
jgi:hypothetical protein